MLRWNPRDELKELRQDVSRWVKRCRTPFSAGWTGRGEERVMRLPLEAYTTADEIVVRAAVPGLRPDEVEVVFEGDTLILSGRFPEPPEHVNHLFQELVTGPFRREVQLNVPVVANQVEARFSNGILTVILPKGPEVRLKAVEVTAIRPRKSPMP